MLTLIQDVRYALRMLRKSPAFTIVAVLTLALGIGANTAIFSLINAVLLKMLPVSKPGELVVLGDPLLVHNRSNGDPRTDIFSTPLYRDLVRESQVFSGMLASGEVHRLRITSTDGAQEISGNTTGALVSGNYFSVLGVNALYGRGLTTDDDGALGASPVAVVSYGFWKDKLADNRNAVGQEVKVNGYPFTVVGVMPPGFYGDTVGDSQSIWFPLAMQEQIVTGRKWREDYNSSWLHLIARLKPGVSMAQASANTNVTLQQLVNGPLGAKLNKGDLDNLKHAKISVVPGGGGFSDLRGDFREPLLLLMVFVALVLIIATVNVANLLLARSSARQREMAVRLAIGATGFRVVRQMLTESLCLAVAGGVLGMLAARWGTKALQGLSRNRELQASPDWRVFLFTAAVCLITGILFGLIPALKLREVALASTLKSGAQTGSEARGSWTAGKVLVSAQVAVSLLVLFSAGLLVRSLQNIRKVDLGYNREHLLLVSTDPMAAGYNNLQITNFCDELVRRLAGVPGVRAATYSKNGLFSGGESATSMKVEGYQSTKEEDLVAAFDQVGPGYFAGVGIPLLLGRDVGPQDTDRSPRVAVINESMAKFYFGSTNPIGRKFTMDDADEAKSRAPFEIVGVARDARDHELKGQIKRRFYLPATQSLGSIPFINFEIRTVGNPTAVADSVRKQMKDLDANVPVYTVRALNELTDNSITEEILVARLSSVFAGLALLLAAIGLYGVLSYSVAGRTREIGVRMALGAQRSSVLGMVLREAGKLVIAGLVIGVPGAMAAGRLCSSMLFGLKSTDPLSMMMVTALLLAIALLASYIPARRATKVDPMVALRYE